MAGRQRADGILIEREVLTGREAERKVIPGIAGYMQRKVIPEIIGYIQKKVIPGDRWIHAGRWEGR
nr:hypothetical protein [Shuttleworthia satelles]